MQHRYLVPYVVDQLLSRFPRGLDVDREDLIGEGYLGLLNAGCRYSEEHGTQFKTYAYLLIRGAVLEALRNYDGRPRAVRETVKKAEEAIWRLQQQLERRPREEEVAQELGISADSYRQSLLCPANGIRRSDLGIRETEALDGRLAGWEWRADEEDPATIVERSHCDLLTRKRLVGALKKLEPRLRRVVALYYFRRMTLKAIGQQLKVTESRVSQLRAQAVSTLRQHFEEMVEVEV